MFRAKFPYETIVHANRFFMPIDFLLGCVDPWATAPALAMLHLARFQEFKVSSTFGQILFETVDKVIPDGHAEMPFAGVTAQLGGFALASAALWRIEPVLAQSGPGHELATMTMLELSQLLANQKITSRQLIEHALAGKKPSSLVQGRGAVQPSAAPTWLRTTSMGADHSWSEHAE